MPKSHAHLTLYADGTIAVRATGLEKDVQQLLNGLDFTLVGGEFVRASTVNDRNRQCPVWDTVLGRLTCLSPQVGLNTTISGFNRDVSKMPPGVSTPIRHTD
jgi:hypothetical protein